MSHSPPLLIVAHPGHELRLHGWLSRMKPTVCVLTDGSGSSSVSRIHNTRSILKNTGCQIGSVFGDWTDLEFYRQVLNVNTSFMLDLADRLLACLRDTNTLTVVGDAAEGYNSTHDICRGVIDAIIARHHRKQDLKVSNLAFPLVGSPLVAPVGLRELAVELNLDDNELQAKLAAAQNYPELAAEVQAAIQQHGSRIFQQELLWQRSSGQEYDHPPSKPPYYEIYGKKRVEKGLFTQLLTFKDHVRPLLASLRAWSIVR